MSSAARDKRWLSAMAMRLWTRQLQRELVVGSNVVEERTGCGPGDVSRGDAGVDASSKSRVRCSSSIQDKQLMYMLEGQIPCLAASVEKRERGGDCTQTNASKHTLFRSREARRQAVYNYSFSAKADYLLGRAAA